MRGLFVAIHALALIQSDRGRRAAMLMPPKPKVAASLTNAAVPA
jgi:hypothetical protein